MYKRYLIFGGAGLCGYQVCRSLVQQHVKKGASAAASPGQILTVASLSQEEAEETCKRLSAEFGNQAEFVPESGNIMVPSPLASLNRANLLKDPSTRKQLLEATYGSLDEAYETNHMVKMIREHRPEVIVDCMNTATGFSYQDIFSCSQKVREQLTATKAKGHVTESFEEEVETLMLSQSVPQLVRHVSLLHRATVEAKTQMYVKIGTTGTGGMGLNIPYTHSEESPSKKLLAKTEAAFGHTGLLFLMARTPNSPIVKEIKPAAMIGYRKVFVKTASDRYNNSHVFIPKAFTLSSGTPLTLSESAGKYTLCGELRMALVDTGENGLFARGEFGSITAYGSMEFITPEEIATIATREIFGGNTGHDVIGALDSSVLDPSYKAGLVRRVAMNDLVTVEKEALTKGDGHAMPSITLGRLGPQLSKYLFEAALFEAAFGDDLAAVAQSTESDVQIAARLESKLDISKVRVLAPTIGVPILLPDGVTLLRGPRITVPEQSGHSTSVSTSAAQDIDEWARKGWVDLRPSNVALWRNRFKQMMQSRTSMLENGSAAVTMQSYLSDKADIGEAVAWILNNEVSGQRVV